MSNKEQIQLFLDTYKRLEGLVSANHNWSVFDYEQQAGSDVAKKLQICRILRNYIQHNEDGFLFAAVSDEMIRFLSNLCFQEQSAVCKNEDIMDRLYAKKLSDKVLPAVKALVQKDIDGVPIIDEKKRLVGVLTKDVAIKIACGYDLNSGVTFESVSRMVKPDYDVILFVKPKEEASHTIAIGEDYDLILVTSDGTKNGTILGSIDIYDHGEE